MKVYIVSAGDFYEEGVIVGVYSSLEKAKAIVEKYKEDGFYDWVDYREYEVE